MSTSICSSVSVSLSVHVCLSCLSASQPVCMSVCLCLFEHACPILPVFHLIPMSWLDEFGPRKWFPVVPYLLIQTNFILCLQFLTVSCFGINQLWIYINQMVNMTWINSEYVEINGEYHTDQFLSIIRINSEYSMNQHWIYKRTVRKWCIIVKPVL